MLGESLDLRLELFEQFLHPLCPELRILRVDCLDRRNGASEQFLGLLLGLLVVNDLKRRRKCIYEIAVGGLQRGFRIVHSEQFSLSFVDLFIEDHGSDSGPGANFTVRIRSGTISGTVLGYTSAFVADNTNLGGGTANRFSNGTLYAGFLTTGSGREKTSI